MQSKLSAWNIWNLTNVHTDFWLSVHKTHSTIYQLAHIKKKNDTNDKIIIEKCVPLDHWSLLQVSPVSTPKVKGD